jgi:ABC-type branched-subunit amino acid transport system substrate-binding protein
MVRRIRASRPDLLYLPVPVEDALLLAPALGFQAIDVPVLGTTHWQSDRLLRLGGVDLEGVLIPGGVPQEDDGILDEFERLYTRRFGTEANRFAAAGFIATRRVVAVLSDVPDADRQHLQQEFASRFGGGFDNNAPMPFLIVQDGALVPYDSR